MGAQLRSISRVSDRIRDLFEDSNAAGKIIEGMDIANIATGVMRTFEEVTFVTDEEVVKAIQVDVELLDLDTWV